jgi:hypothetical protein
MGVSLVQFFYQLFKFFSLPSFAQADIPRPKELSASIIVGYLNKIVSYIFPVVGILSVAFIIYGGYMWMISGGDPEKVKKAQGTLTWAIIGLVFTILSRLILGIIYGGFQSS